MGSNSQINSPIVLFDGVCNLCNHSVDFVLRHDKSGHFRFASLQSDFAVNLLRSFGIVDPEAPETVYLIKNGTFYKESKAALLIARELTGMWSLMYVFMIVPAFVRDPIYRWISGNRYRWFGKRESCRIPEPGLKNRFLD